MTGGEHTAVCFCPQRLLSDAEIYPFLSIFPLALFRPSFIPEVSCHFLLYEPSVQDVPAFTTVLLSSTVLCT